MEYDSMSLEELGELTKRVQANVLAEKQRRLERDMKPGDYVVFIESGFSGQPCGVFLGTVNEGDPAEVVNGMPSTYGGNYFQFGRSKYGPSEWLIPREGLALARAVKLA